MQHLRTATSFVALSIVSLPVVACGGGGQRRIVDGLTAGGVKG